MGLSHQPRWQEGPAGDTPTPLTTSSRNETTLAPANLSSSNETTLAPANLSSSIETEAKAIEAAMATCMVLGAGVDAYRLSQLLLLVVGASTKGSFPYLSFFGFCDRDMDKGSYRWKAMNDL